MPLRLPMRRILKYSSSATGALGAWAAALAGGGACVTDLAKLTPATRSNRDVRMARRVAPFERRINERRLSQPVTRWSQGTRGTDHGDTKSRRAPETEQRFVR